MPTIAPAGSNAAATIYAYANLDVLLGAEICGGAKADLPGAGDGPLTERPSTSAT